MLLLLLIVIIFLDIAALLVVDAVGGLAQYASLLRLVLPLESSRRLPTASDCFRLLPTPSDSFRLCHRYALFLRLVRFVRHCNVKGTRDLASVVEQYGNRERDRLDKLRRTARKTATLKEGKDGKGASAGEGAVPADDDGHSCRRQVAVRLALLAGTASRRLQVTQYRFAYNVLTGFMFAREEAENRLYEFADAAEDGELRALFLSAVMAVKEDISSVRAYMRLLQQEEYELHASLTTMIAARTVLNAQRRSVRHLHHEGVLERGEADRLSGRIDRSMERLMRHPPLIRLPDNASLLKRVSWLHDASDEDLRALLRGGQRLSPEAHAAAALLRGHGHGGNKGNALKGLGHGAADADGTGAVEELVFEGGETIVAQGELQDAVYVLKRGTLLVVNEPSPGAREIELDQLLLGAAFNVVSFALRTPSVNGVRAAGQATVLRLPGATVNEVVHRSPTLQHALWTGVGRKAAEVALAKMGELAKWQIERIVRRLESHHVGDDHVEYQFVKSMTVVLISGAASYMTASSTHAVDWTVTPPAQWHVPPTEGPQQLKPKGAHASTSSLPFFTVVFAPGSRFVAEEESIHSKRTAWRKRTQTHGLGSRSTVADVASNTLALMRAASSGTPVGHDARLRLLQMQLSGDAGGGHQHVSGLRRNGAKRSVLQMQLAASRTINDQHKKEINDQHKKKLSCDPCEASGATLGASFGTPSRATNWHAALLAARFTAPTHHHHHLDEADDACATPVARSVSRALHSSWTRTRPSKLGDVEAAAATPERLLTRGTIRSTTRGTPTARALSRRERTVKGLHGVANPVASTPLPAGRTQDEEGSVAATMGQFGKCGAVGSLARLASTRSDLRAQIEAAEAAEATKASAKAKEPARSWWQPDWHKSDPLAA